MWLYGIWTYGTMSENVANLMVSEKFEEGEVITREGARKKEGLSEQGAAPVSAA